MDMVSDRDLSENCLCHEKVSSDVERHECDIKDKLNSGIFYWLFGILVTVLIVAFGANAYQLEQLSNATVSMKETIAIISTNQQGVLVRQSEMTRLHNNSLEIQARLSESVTNIVDRVERIERVKK
jgi:hypothetical protein